MIFNKIWGTTSKIFEHNNVELHRIEIVKGGFCSKHYHQFKFNGFYLESGALDIHVWNRDSGILDITHLNSGDYTMVKPTVVHMFLAKEKSIAYEIYWTQIEENDIVRETIGGLMKPVSIVN